MASGWNLWVWLPCIGVVSGCCCKEVYRYPHNNNIINFPYSTLFLAAASLLLCSFKKNYIIHYVSFIPYKHKHINMLINKTVTLCGACAER